MSTTLEVRDTNQVIQTSNQANRAKKGRKMLHITNFPVEAFTVKELCELNSVSTPVAARAIREGLEKGTLEKVAPVRLNTPGKPPIAYKVVIK